MGDKASADPGKPDKCSLWGTLPVNSQDKVDKYFP